MINPATDEVVAKLPHASKADLDRAIASAQKAFVTWRKTSPIEKSRILRKVAELSRERAKEIGRNMTFDMGKPLAEAISEVTACSEHADRAAEECRRIYGRVVPARPDGVRPMVLSEPIGVVAAFSPWNFPYNQAIRKIVSALGAGCTIVIKGPEDAPTSNGPGGRRVISVSSRWTGSISIFFQEPHSAFVYRSRWRHCGFFLSKGLTCPQITLHGTRAGCSARNRR